MVPWSVRARVLVSLRGCGRISFDPRSDAVTDTGAEDSALPAMVCSAQRVPAPMVTNIDLAATAVASGGYAVATAQVTPAPLLITRLDGQGS